MPVPLLRCVDFRVEMPRLGICHGALGASVDCALCSLNLGIGGVEGREKRLVRGLDTAEIIDGRDGLDAAVPTVDVGRMMVLMDLKPSLSSTSMNLISLSYTLERRLNARSTSEWLPSGYGEFEGLGFGDPNFGSTFDCWILGSALGVMALFQCGVFALEVCAFAEARWEGE